MICDPRELGIFTCTVTLREFYTALTVINLPSRGNLQFPIAFYFYSYRNFALDSKFNYLFYVRG